jgi:phospholipid/cholesterol/gamma-HCH transport system permease protein
MSDFFTIININMTILTIIQNPISSLGRTIIKTLQVLGHLTIFLFKGLGLMFSLPLQVAKTLEQIYFIGAKSIFVICLTGLFTGAVLGLQGYIVLSKFGATAALGAAVALPLIREMGPVLTAIMIIARAGSAIAAELGIMRIQEEIDALETMDINSIRFLISPRIAAALISFPLLTALFDVVGIVGGYLTGSVLLGLSKGTYFSQMQSSIDMTDINAGFIKSIVFAVVAATICCYQGYYTHLRKDGFGAKGVGLSTTSAVVTSCVLILTANYVTTSLLL